MNLTTETCETKVVFIAKSDVGEPNCRSSLKSENGVYIVLIKQSKNYKVEWLLIQSG